MENNNEQPFKFSALLMNFIALIIVIVNVISERVGTYPHYSGGRYSQSELLGIVIPIMMLIMPFFVRKYRQQCWNKNTLILTFGVLIISIFLVTVMYANKEYYNIVWIENGGWNWDNSPPIHWDFWNIL